MSDFNSREAFGLSTFHNENHYSRDNQMMQPYIKREPGTLKEEKQDKNKYPNIEDNVHTRSHHNEYYLAVKEHLDRTQNRNTGISCAANRITLYEDALVRGQEYA